VAVKLHAFADSGCQVFIMHGNRDFLIGNQFAQQCGAQLIEEPYVLELAGKSCLLMHGDTLCIDDKLYMDFRAMVRNPEWQRAFLDKPLQDRIAFGKQARNQSQEDAKEKSNEILDVTPSEVVRVMNEHSAELFIHGHTHRPCRHQVETLKGACERVVLGDWHEKGWYILADDNGLALKSVEFN
jgi:UDP-2,3-diacylglucosamine hydrolase